MAYYSDKEVEVLEEITNDIVKANKPINKLTTLFNTTIKDTPKENITSNKCLSTLLILKSIYVFDEKDNDSITWGDILEHCVPKSTNEYDTLFIELMRLN